MDKKIKLKYQRLLNKVSFKSDILEIYFPMQFSQHAEVINYYHSDFLVTYEMRKKVK